MWTMKALDTVGLYKEDSLHRFINTYEVYTVQTIVYNTVVILPISDSYDANLDKILDILCHG